MIPLKLPIKSSVYNKLPLCLRLLSFHVPNNAKESFIAYTEGKHPKISTLATNLWYQDFTGVPEIRDFAEMRDALAEIGLDPKIISSKVDTHLIFDHSVRTKGSLSENTSNEIKLNEGRIRLAKWGSKALGIKLIPPGKGVIHQVNLERLLNVFNKDGLPTFGKGTDSHSPMVNALGILAWGVGGSEAKLVFNNESVDMEIPQCFGVELKGKLSPGINSSDFALYLKKIMREMKVTGGFVEFYGKGVKSLSLEGRATISNIAAEFGSRTALFGIDDETIRFLKQSSRSKGVKKLAKAYGLWYNDINFNDIIYTKTIVVNLKEVKRGINGPNTPHNWVNLDKAKERVEESFVKNNIEPKTFTVLGDDGNGYQVQNGALLLASLASCTHTANPDSILKAALMVKKAAKLGLKPAPWVKTAFASGSKLADHYLEKLGLNKYLEKLGFDITAFGCGACIGQSGGLNDIGNKLIEQGLTPTSIVSANRNYAGRADGNISVSFLAAPDLIIAYSLIGRLDVNINTYDFGNGITLADITPTDTEIADAKKVINAKLHKAAYKKLFKGTTEFNNIDYPKGDLYDWPSDVLVQKSGLLEGISAIPSKIIPIENAAILGIFGDNFSTDAISPAGNPLYIPPAVEYLKSYNVKPENTLATGGYRSNAELLVTTIFSNPTNHNLMVDKKGGYTIHQGSEKTVFIVEAAKLYRNENRPVIVIGGENYGCGSSRVMAASGPAQLGVKVIIAKSYEAIHRSNLWQNGIVPLMFKKGEDSTTLKLDGSESWDIPLDLLTNSSKILKTQFKRKNNEIVNIELEVALESEQEFNFFVHGGSMQQQIREMAK